MILNAEKLAECLGLSRTRIGQLVHEGMPKQARGKYDLAVCVRWYLDYRLKSGPSASSDVNEARKRLYDAQVEKTQLETAKIKREYIPADEHLIDMNQLAVLFTGGLDSVSGRLSAELAGMNDAAEIAERLILEHNAIRESVADAIEAYAKGLDTSD